MTEEKKDTPDKVEAIKKAVAERPEVSDKTDLLDKIVDRLVRRKKSKVK